MGGTRYRYRIFHIEYSLRDGEKTRHPIAPVHTSAEVAQRDCFLHNLNDGGADSIFVVIKERIDGR